MFVYYFLSIYQLRGTKVSLLLWVKKCTFHIDKTYIPSSINVKDILRNNIKKIIKGEVSLFFISVLCDSKLGENGKNWLKYDILMSFYVPKGLLSQGKCPPPNFLDWFNIEQAVNHGVCHIAL